MHQFAEGRKGIPAILVKATTGVCEACPHHAPNLFVIGVIPSHTHGNVCWWSP